VLVVATIVRIERMRLEDLGRGDGEEGRGETGGRGSVR
jgi:hypothetical protein